MLLLEKVKKNGFLHGNKIYMYRFSFCSLKTDSHNA